MYLCSHLMQIPTVHYCTVSAGKNFTRQNALFKYLYQATFYTNLLQPIII